MSCLVFAERLVAVAAVAAKLSASLSFPRGIALTVAAAAWTLSMSRLIGRASPDPVLLSRVLRFFEVRDPDGVPVNVLNWQSALGEASTFVP